MRILFLFCFFLSTSFLFSQGTGSSNKKPSDFFYRGNRVIIEPKNDFVHLSGNALVNNKGTILKADNIVVDNKNNSVTATGNVSLTNRKKDVFYQGDEINYDTKRKLARSFQRSTVTRKQNNIHFSANVIELDLNENIMKGNGDALLFINHKQLDELTATGDYAFYDLKKGTARLSKKVLIVETGKNKIEPKSGSTINCDRVLHETKSKWTTCTGNGIYHNEKKRETLSSDLLTYNQKTDQLETKGNSFYKKDQIIRNITVKSDNMFLKNKEKTIDLEGSVLYSQYSPTNKNPIYQAGCEKALIIETKTKNHEIECQEKVRLRNVGEQTTIEGGYLFYNEDEKKGFMTNNPVINFEKENLTKVFSTRLELDDQQKKVDLIGNVIAKEYMKEQKNVVHSTIKCEKGLYLYEGNEKIDPKKGNVLECHDDVVVDREKEQLVVKGDQLNYYTVRKLSELRGNVNFVKSNSNDQHFEGTSGELDVDDQKKYLFFRKGFNVDSYKNGEKEGSFSGDHGNYNYSEKGRLLRANKDIFVNNTAKKYRVWSDHVEYDVDEKVTVFTGNPLLEKDANQKNKNFSYGKVLKINEKDEEAFLEGPVFAGEVSNSMTLPRDHLWILQKDNRQNYIRCNDAKYIFAQETNLIECQENVVGTNYEEYQKITSDLLLLDIDKRIYKALGDVEIIENNPQRNMARHIKSKEADLNSAEKIVTFQDDVSMFNKGPLGKIRQSIDCKKGIYNYFEKGKRTFFCHDDVVINDYAQDFTVNGDLLRYYLDQKYILIDNNPSFYSTNTNGTTKITANVFEYFEDEDIVYAKGDVQLENNFYNVKSLFGDYNLKEKEMMLFGNAEIIRRDGSKILANRTVIDTTTQDIVLEENIRGFFPFSDAADETSTATNAADTNAADADATNGSTSDENAIDTNILPTTLEGNNNPVDGNLLSIPKSNTTNKPDTTNVTNTTNTTPNITNTANTTNK